jgi:glycosyltransferase involved in cell wall biosynthesis
LTGANILATLAGKLAGVKLIFPGIRNAYLPPVKAFADRFLTNVVSSKAVLNCHSGFLYFSSEGFKAEKLKVIPNCFENIADFKEKTTSEKVRIISVGRFVPQKDYETALQAIKLVKKQYPKIIYQIVGFGDLEDFIRKRVVELGLVDNVEIYINPNNIPDLLKASDIYLSTSIFEGTSNSIMEAMNGDLPVVATNVGDNDQLIIDRKNGYLCAIKDTLDIANKLILLIENPQKRIKMGRSSKQHLLDNFSVEKFTKSYIELIEFNLK